MIGVRFCRSIGTIAYKEFIHVWRDRRILLSIIVLPPFFTLVFGHAFEEQQTLQDIPALLYDADRTTESAKLIEHLKSSKSFVWREWKEPETGTPNLLQNHASAAVIIPAGWGQSLHNGDPKPLRVVLDGTDTNTAPAIEGILQGLLGEFQMKMRDEMIDNLPDQVFEMGRTLPPGVRNEFGSAMTPWIVQRQILYNPGLKFIDFIVPGIVGLILQLLTVTLIASTITREREVGTLSQLLVTPLRQSEVVIGKVIPYLLISLVLIASTIFLSHLHFGVHFQRIHLLALVCLLFLLCSLGLGLLISAFSKTQTQAIQFSVFVLLPVFILSGAFAPLDQLPEPVQWFSQFFPLTHFCHAFRQVNMYSAPFRYIVPDLLVLGAGALVTCGVAAYLLRTGDD
jgi:ABC-type multidrug transport system permease subunit